jgi:acyl transferase domain-containing protein
MSYKQPVSEPIAIVGSSCRFAGGVTSTSKLWTLLQSPRDLSREIPRQRFNIDGFYHPDGEYHGTTNSPKGYWLDQDHRVFDSSFFSITPKETEAIDPQQRMLLEVVYEALESSGYALHQWSTNKVAVFAGVMTADYDTLQQRDDLTSNQYLATGNARSIISNRISYFFNFQGPSVTIDTACSSSLVALHQAVLSLRSGESDMACVTGSNLMLTPEQFIVESSLHMLSSSGHCRMWDADADGYARGEGIAAMFIKPLSRALSDGDHIEAVIRETGVNSDGRTRGITMPNPEAQARLINDTYRKTGLDPKKPEDRCQYFEAHGTGTHAGDPREAAAIEDAFFGLVSRRDTDTAKANSSDEVSSSQKLIVGSVKTVIGHTEGAAGLAGVFKVVQSMRHGFIPPNLHIQSLNPSVEPFYANLYVPIHLLRWPSPPRGQPYRASVNSFGFGGTNSHAIIERYEPMIHDRTARFFSPSVLNTRPITSPKDDDFLPVCLPLVLSASSQKSLVTVVQSYREYVAQLDNDESYQGELGWNTFKRRTALQYRVTVSPGSSRSDLLQSLDSLLAKAQQSMSAKLGIRAHSVNGKQRILGIFTGQGAQWATMSRGLIQTSNVYRDTIRNLDRILSTCPHPPAWSLEQEILSEDDFSRLSKAAIAQPVCTALQIAQVDLLHNLGIDFHTVVGHSSGEIAAAYAARRLSARDAILISYYRGMHARFAGRSRGVPGGMLAVGLSMQEAIEFCANEEYRGAVCVAASNSPQSVTLSGDLDVIRNIRDDLIERDKFARLLQVDIAYHSPHMEIPAARYSEALKLCEFSPLERKDSAVWVSSVYGSSEPITDELRVTYWTDNMVKPVLFYEAVSTALENSDPFDFIIEVGPHPTLKGPVKQTMKEMVGDAPPPPYSGLLDRKKDDRHAFADFLGMMWTHLGPDSVRIDRFLAKSSQPELLDSRLEDLPSYPWDHSQIHYRESRISRQYHFRKHAPHELLGVRTRDDSDTELRWRNILKLDKVPWLRHHRFQGQALLPAAAYCVMAVDAARLYLDGRPASVIELQDLEFVSGIVLDDDSHGVEIMFSMFIMSPTRRESRAQNTIEACFTISSCPVDGSSYLRRNFTGKMRIIVAPLSVNALPTRPIRVAETMRVSTQGFYEMTREIGLEYSGPFKGLHSIERRFQFSTASLKKRHVEDTTKMSISPATLDTCFQSAFATFSSPGDK